MSNTYFEQELNDGSLTLTAFCRKGDLPIFHKPETVSVQLSLEQVDELVQQLIRRRSVSATD